MSEGYDTFLSYTSSDRPFVRSIYDYLTRMGLKVWFDEENNRPGDNWMTGIYQGMESAKTCVVFFRDEPGVWHQQETEAAIRKREGDKSRSFKIIPVILPEARDPESSLPSFLKGTVYVDLRGGLRDLPALVRLAAAIRGDQSVPIHPIPEGAQADNKLPLGYRAEVNKIISLLIGEALYSRRDVGIRELIQNAVDACERQGFSRRGSITGAEVLVIINTEEGFFEIWDNGEGMSPRLLSDYFAVVGKSIRDEEDIIDRTQEDERTRAHLLAKFGIGFISVYMLAKKVWISTTHEGCDQINLEIKGISELFSYPPSSLVGRPPGEVGTTVRVYLKEKFLRPGNSLLDPLAVVEEFCRHVPYVKVIKDSAVAPLKGSWNTEGALALEVTKVPSAYELHLGLSNKNLNFFASNAGFLIAKRSDAITPKYMPMNIGGEISFYPGAVDLNIARDQIIVNEKSARIRGQVSTAIKSLLRKATDETEPGIQEMLKRTLAAYLHESLRYEEITKPAPDKSSGGGARAARVVPAGVEAPPLSSIEAAEFLLDAWSVNLDGKEISFREALRVLKEKGKYRVYYSDYHVYTALFALFRDILKRLGFLVVPVSGDKIEFKSGQNLWVSYEKTLKQLSEKYFFDVLAIETPLPEDIEGLVTSVDTLPPPMRKVIDEIERAQGKKIYLSRLSGAPAVFEISGNTYLNFESELLRKLGGRFGGYDNSILKSYILGLLQYEMH